MIEIVMDKERNLKNLKQIGTPKEEEKIYVENLAYTKLKEESYKEKRIFVLMGHSERMQGRYATFIEAVIPVKDVEFVGNVPRWNNTAWSEVFREVRRLYEDMIIVGWAIDIKGMSPKMTTDLERVHREHFGGVHQVLFLLDTLEQEETFYVYKENRLVSKDGFYIYYHAHKNLASADVEKEPVQIRAIEETYSHNNHVEVDLDLQEVEQPRRGQYRQLMQEHNKGKKSDGSNMGLAMAVAMLVFVIGVGIYENRDTFLKKPNVTETNLLQEEDSVITEETSVNAEETVGEDIIPVETIHGEEEDGSESQEDTEQE